MKVKFFILGILLAVFCSAFSFTGPTARTYHSEYVQQTSFSHSDNSSGIDLYFADLLADDNDDNNLIKKKNYFGEYAFTTISFIAEKLQDKCFKKIPSASCNTESSASLVISLRVFRL